MIMTLRPEATVCQSITSQGKGHQI